MRLRLLFLLIVFTGGSRQAFAQVYEPGFLVRSNGDTLRGELENGFWVEPPTSLRFRAAPNSPSQLFKPHQLRCFSFAGGRAFRYEGLPIDHAARSTVGNLPYENRPDVQVDSLLAEVLVDGPVSLVRVQRSERPTHYVLLSAGRPPLDLSERKYLRQTVDRAWLLTDGNNYQGQLSVYFGDCPAAHSAAQKVTFTEKNLVAVVQAYNEACAHRPGRNLLEQAAPRHRVAFQGGLLAGARYHHIESGSEHFQGECVDCQVHPFAGLYSELFQPGRSAAVYGELSVSKFHSKGAERAGYNAVGTNQYNEYAFDAWLTTARIGMRYFINLPREQFAFVGLGYELNFVSGASITPGTAGTAPTAPDLYYASPVFFPNLSAGWRYRRFTLSLDGQMYMSSDLTQSSGTGSGLSQSGRFAGTVLFGTNFATRFGLSYRLGRNSDASR